MLSAEVICKSILIIFILLSTAFLVTADHVQAEDQLQQNIDINAEIQPRAIAVDNPDNSALDFGRFSAPSAEDGNGTVCIIPSSDSPEVCSAIPYHDQNGQRAKLEVSGQASLIIEVSLPEVDYVEHVNSDQYSEADNTDMAVDNFQTNMFLDQGSLNSEGLKEFYIGARLNIEHDQVLGRYEGQFEVQINYQ